MRLTFFIHNLHVVAQIFQKHGNDDKRNIFLQLRNRATIINNDKVARESLGLAHNYNGLFNCYLIKIVETIYVLSLPVMKSQRAVILGARSPRATL